MFNPGVILVLAQNCQKQGPLPMGPYNSLGGSEIKFGFLNIFFDSRAEYS